MIGTPFPRSYWVYPGKFLAGCYPGDKDPSAAFQKLAGLLDHRIRHVINLMEEDEVDHDGRPFMPYDTTLARLAAQRGVEVFCERFPIRDLGIPGREDMRLILDAVDRAIGRGMAVYVHCWGGKGRTGTVVGCWLARHGIARGPAVLEEIRRLRRRDPCAHEPSPETAAQRAMATSWGTGE
ncbi:MAG TPA: hypothetical protein P5269_09385 [Syntrophales bacterium]|nr:hypothetical protein [Syntrophales bacterium]HOM08034.1 hypothetical protein [Syntrophales bacterium]HOO00676.1 hypothetical protein [Syntrophales bacterium]HPQ07460.1 hypothetical protein [Syntrophales bacterium]HRS87828.1 hypothetical protein [Syntrophales bacterium]